MPNLTPSIREAADAILRADALIIAAGAGMGVDSGLPDFRGNEGFWKAYPHAARLGLSFADLANPRWFAEDPDLAWGFYGHRAALYRERKPHAGFEILRRWGETMSLGAFVFTSNVDGHFQRAGFADENVWECHGSITSLQCTRPCSDVLWPLSTDAIPRVDLSTFRTASPIPTCPHCGGVARPNILMFGDMQWNPMSFELQSDRFERWTAKVRSAEASVVIFELGAGTAVPTVRHFSELKSSAFRCPLIRINPREPHAEGAYHGIEISTGALKALENIQAALDSHSK